MAPEALKRAAALEGAWRDEVVAAADSGDAVYVDGALVGTVAEGASPNQAEPWRAVWSKEAKTIKAWQRAEEATRAMVTKEAAAATKATVFILCSFFRLLFFYFCPLTSYHGCHRSIA